MPSMYLTSIANTGKILVKLNGLDDVSKVTLVTLVREQDETNSIYVYLTEFAKT